MVLALFLMSAAGTWFAATSYFEPEEDLVVVPAKVDLGEVDQRDGIPFELTICNNYHGSLKITEVLKPCTCTDIDLAADTTLASRERRRVRGTVDTSSRRGSTNMSFALTFKAPSLDGERTLAIPLVMRVRPAITCSEEPVILNDSSWKTVVVGTSDGKPLRVSGIEPSDPYILWEPIDTPLNEACASFRMRLRLDRSRLLNVDDLTQANHWLTITTLGQEGRKLRLAIKFQAGGLGERTRTGRSQRGRSPSGQPTSLFAPVPASHAYGGTKRPRRLALPEFG